MSRKKTKLSNSSSLSSSTKAKSQHVPPETKEPTPAVIGKEKETENDGDKDIAVQSKLKLPSGLTVEELKQKQNSKLQGTTTNGKQQKQQEEKPLTKRQLMKQRNTKNVWPQQPRITSAEARAKAYLRVSGLVHAPKDEIPANLDLHSPSVRFGRSLASPDQRQRHQAVLKLEKYLKERCAIPVGNSGGTTKDNGDDENKDDQNSPIGISEMDLLKLWKALWHTLYMADKVPVQEELCHKIANLIWCLAGTEEEDEYAGQAYMNLCQELDEIGSLEDDDDDDDEKMVEGDCCDKGGCGGCEMLEEDKEGFEQESSDSSSDEDDEEESSDSSEEEDGDDDEDDDGLVIQEIIRRSADGTKMEVLQEKDLLKGRGKRKRGGDEDGNSSDQDSEGDDDNEDEEEDVDPHTIPHCRGAHLSSLFVRTFFVTVRREWGHMDKHRVDKFYSLIRCVMHQVYKYMSLRHWNLGIIRLFNDAILEEVLTHKPNGIRYHLIDLTLEELANVHAQAPMPLTEATFFDCLQPYFYLAQTGDRDHSVQKRVVEKILEQFLDKYSVVSEDANEEKKDGDETQGNDSSFIFSHVHVGTIADNIFEMASATETHDAYRKSLYDLHKKYKRRLKIVGRDVDLQASMGHEENEDEYNHDPEEQERQSDETRVSSIVADGPTAEVVEVLTSAEKHQEESESSNKKKKNKKNKKKQNETEKRNDAMIEENASSSRKSQEKEEQTNDSNVDANSCKRQLFDMHVEGEEKEKKSSKKEKKKKKLKEKEMKNNIDSNQETINAESLSDTKKQKGDGSNSMDAIKPQDDTNNVTTEPTSKDKSGKKKKKKKRSSESSQEEDKNIIEKAQTGESGSNGSKVKGVVDSEEEEEVVISVQDQKKAKSAMTAAKLTTPEPSSTTTTTNDSSGDKTKRKHKKRAKDDVDTDDKNADSLSKRVKFGDVNMARSWKVSMKKLRMANPATPPAAPEQGILLNKQGAKSAPSKIAVARSAKLKQKRRRASDYF